MWEDCTGYSFVFWSSILLLIFSRKAVGKTLTSVYLSIFFLAGQISPGKSLPVSHLERVKIYRLHFGDQVGEEVVEDDFLIPLNETKHAGFYQAEEGLGL